MEKHYWWLPPHYSSYGDIVDLMFLVIFIITSIAMVGVFAVMGYFLMKYRKRPGQKAYYTHGSHKLEIVWTVTPAIILVILGLWSNKTWDEIKNSIPEHPGAVVKVVGEQFAFNAHYPGPDGKFSTDDDKPCPMEKSIVVPVDEDILLKLTSQDVIHSLFIPNLRVKQDAVPGTTGDVWFRCTRATEPGPDGQYATVDDITYEIACAELCGQGHYTMKARLFVLPRPDYDRWIEALFPK